MLPLSTLAGVAFTLLVSTSGVVAQGTNATCLATFDWMDNSRGQNPCLVTAYLNGACLPNPADSFVYSLDPGFHYRPPTVQTATACQCSSVLYSAVQACALCQGDPILPWSTWNSNCTAAIYESVFPENIPAGTAVPAWAYLDVVKGDTFNSTGAQGLAAQGIPESTSTNGPTATSSLPSPSSSSSAVAASSGKKSSNAGAIAGGVVGGILGLAVVALLVWFFYWRTRNSKKRAPSGQYDGNYTPAPLSPYTSTSKGQINGNGYNQSPPMAQYGAQPQIPPNAPFIQHPIAQYPSQMGSPTPVSSGGYSTTVVGTPVSTKPYDPNDPSTFPSAGGHDAYPQQPGAYGNPQAAAPGRYSGMPEL